MFDTPRAMLALRKAETLQAMLEAYMLKLRQNWEQLDEDEQAPVEAKYDDAKSRLYGLIDKADDLCADLRGLMETISGDY